MTSYRWWSLLALASVCAGLAFGAWRGRTEPEVAAGVAERLDVEGLVDRSARVLEGRVLGRRTVERLDGSLDTEYRVAVARDFLDGGVAETTVRLPGGLRADGSGLVIAGVPRLEVGEDALLFLSDREAGRELTVGLAQGRFTLLTDRDGVRRAVRSGVATALAARARTAGVRGAESRPYAELVAEVEAAVNRRRAREGAGR